LLFGPVRIARRERLRLETAMTTDAAFETLREHGGTQCTAQFWMSETPARTFDSLRQCLTYLADQAADEPLPDVHIHAASGEIAINGPDLHDLIATARASRSAT
jgi:hypothetical protein